MSRITVKIAADTSELVRLQQEANRFSARLKQSFEFATGAHAFAVAAAGVHKIRDGLEEAVRQGVEFNAEMESSQIGIARVLRQFAPGQFQTFGKAMEGAGEAIDRLKVKARSGSATLPELSETFMSLAGAASQAGLGMQQQITLTSSLVRALGSLGFHGERLTKEARSILAGGGTSEAARMLGISQAAVEQATEEGRLYEYLTSKIRGFGEGSDVASQTYSGALARMQGNTQQLFAELSQPIFETLRASLIELNRELNTVDFKSALRSFFDDASAVVHVFAELAVWSARNAEGIGELVRILAHLAGAYGALRITNMLTAIGRELALRKASVSAIAAETAAVEANTVAKMRNAAAAAGAAATNAGGAPLGLPAPRGIELYGTGLGPFRGRPGAQTIDVEMQVTRVAAARSMRSMFGQLSKTAAEWTKSAAQLAAANPMPVIAAAMAGWEVGKALRRPLFGHNGAEDLGKAGDYQARWNERAGAFDAQRRAVTSIGERQKYINDLLEARSEIEDQLTREDAPLLRRELETQLRLIDMMADGAQRIGTNLMDANKARVDREAAVAKQQGLIQKNSGLYDEGRKKFGMTDIQSLEKDIADLSKGGDVAALTERYQGLGAGIDALKNQPEIAHGELDQAERELSDARRKLSAEKAKGVAGGNGGFAGGMSFAGTAATTEASAKLLGDVAGAQAALEAADAKAKKLRELHDMEVAARDAALAGNQAEAEKIRQTIDKLKEKQKALEELQRARRRTGEALAISEAEARGDFGRAETIKRRQARDDLEGQLKDQGRSPQEISGLLDRFNDAIEATQSRERNRTRGDLAIGEAEAGGNYHGAEQLRRQRALDDYRDTLSRQGFSPSQQDEMVKRQGAIQGAEQTKALRRFNLEQRSLELRGQGKLAEAKTVERAMKKDELTERFQREFGLDPKAAASLADKRLVAEAAVEHRGVTASRLQKIGGGGGYGGGGERDPATLLREIRDVLKDVKVNTKPGRSTTWPSDVIRDN
jgi:hypothetical protein